jgi:hypothetical protein
MSPSLLGLLIAWGVLTGLLVVVLIYRSTLTMQEDDQLFLNASEDHMAREQHEIMRRVDNLRPYVAWLGGASALLIVAIAGLAAYSPSSPPG